MYIFIQYIHYFLHILEKKRKNPPQHRTAGDFILFFEEEILALCFVFLAENYLVARRSESSVVSPNARFQSALKPAMEASVVVCESRRDITSAPTVAV